MLKKADFFVFYFSHEGLEIADQSFCKFDLHLGAHVLYGYLDVVTLYFDLAGLFLTFVIVFVVILAFFRSLAFLWLKLVLLLFLYCRLCFGLLLGFDLP